MQEQTTQTSQSQSTDDVLTLPTATAPASDIGEAAPHTEASAPVLYEADAAQLVTVEVEADDTVWDVPLRAAPLTDELIRAYAAKRDELDAGERSNTAEASANVRAAEQCFAQFIQRAEIEGDAPALVEMFGAQDMYFIIGELLACGVPDDAPAPKRGGVLQAWPAGGRRVTARVTLRCAFNGAAVATAHVLRKADAETYVLYARGVLEQGGELAQLDTLAAAYDKLHVAHEGYAGRVPIHHKAAAVRVHLERAVRVTRKN